LESLLEVNDLKVHFPITKGILSRTVGYVYAVDGVSFELAAGETLGIVGESGCGKTTAGLAILRLIEPTDGQVIFQGKDISQHTKQERLTLRRKMQVIFQDPYSSLTPSMKWNRTISGPMKIHGLYSKSARKDRVAYLLEKVGLTPEQGRRYPTNSAAVSGNESA